jgi:hypothetical protein
MKIKHEDKIYETKLNQYGHVVSLDEKIFFGTSEDNILVGEIHIEPEVEEVIEPRPDSSWLVADIKLWLDANGIEYTSSMLKADLLALA